ARNSPAGNNTDLHGLRPTAGVGGPTRALTGYITVGILNVESLVGDRGPAVRSAMNTLWVVLIASLLPPLLPPGAATGLWDRVVGHVFNVPGKRHVENVPHSLVRQSKALAYASLI